MVDSTYISADERYAVVLDELDIDAKRGRVSLLYFPASFTGLTEESYYHQKVIRPLIEKSQIFRKGKGGAPRLWDPCPSFVP